MRQFNDTIRCDTTPEFNVARTAECGQINVAQVTKNEKYKKKLKQTNASAHLVRSIAHAVQGFIR